MVTVRLWFLTVEQNSSCGNSGCRKCGMQLTFCDATITGHRVSSHSIDCSQQASSTSMMRWIDLLALIPLAFCTTRHKSPVKLQYRATRLVRVGGIPVSTATTHKR